MAATMLTVLSLDTTIFTPTEAGGEASEGRGLVTTCSVLLRTTRGQVALALSALISPVAGAVASSNVAFSLSSFRNWDGSVSLARQYRVALRRSGHANSSIKGCRSSTSFMAGPGAEDLSQYQEGRRKLNRKEFVKKLTLHAVKSCFDITSEAIKRLGPWLFKTLKVKPVVPPQKSSEFIDSSHRLVLLRVSTNEDVPSAVSMALTSLEATVMPYPLTVDYEDLTAEEVLRSLLPADVEAPASFEAAGHVAHFNLRPEALPYKHVIGQVFLDKNPRIRTVVNKVSSIESQFRTFPLEVLAGDPDLNVEVRESGAVFRFNFAEVYWNSRLQAEHERLIRSIAPGSLVWDVFAGVGPFAVPLAMKGCSVWANDLNRRSYRYLCLNAEANNVVLRQHGGFEGEAAAAAAGARGPTSSSSSSSSRRQACGGVVHASNLDGRAFIEHMLASASSNSTSVADHVIMNLPDSALGFLDAFKAHLLHMERGPVIHVYSFTTDVHDPEGDVIKRACAVLGIEDLGPETRVRLVRDVAPKKLMMCLSFRLRSGT